MARGLLPVCVCCVRACVRACIHECVRTCACACASKSACMQMHAEFKVQTNSMWLQGEGQCVRSTARCQTSRMPHAEPNIHTCQQTCLHTCSQAWLRKHACVHAYTRVCTHAHAHVDRYVYRYVYRNVHTQVAGYFSGICQQTFLHVC